MTIEITQSEVRPYAATRRVLLACWLSILFEGYDVGVMGAVLSSMAEDSRWGLTPMQLGALSSYALVGMFFGACVAGTLSERIGRRRMLLLCVGLFSLAMLATAWAPTPFWFGVARLIGGLGLGGVIPMAAALTVEYSPPARRSYNYGIMYSGYSLGILCAALVAMWLIPHFGWRSVIGVGALPLLALVPIARLLPESLEYLVSRGRMDEARQLAQQLGVPLPQTGAPHPGAQQPGWRHTLGLLFSPAWLRATLCFWVALFCGMLLVYGLNTWLPTIMRKSGYALGPSLLFLVVFSLTSAIGGLCLGRIADRLGARRAVALSYLLGAAGICALMFKHSLGVNILLTGIAGLGSISASLILTGYLATWYPGASRAAATGWALSFARIGAMSGPLFGAWIAGSGLALSWNFAAFALVSLVAALAVLLLPRR
ncbi:MFS transporter [Shimwellia blattae]|uniref:Major facilitator transporter n=1 Tax=Shimwellia blattae (strain ATCC 29907 / DSM 4481 / JCM 1650 / NBRC 105725 / CDC 9005-74) TaxID=630626 RepID=I2BBF8_SHIBC|nr:aromatic acid/H+ symport family MFS transporter [Shimwellia blattae]AFJ47862.1 major facilitator transporter [Shimwellia blattae DSM 4481 = NBRC 105725]GAB79567.1 putative 3-hydroxyphenylpropionic acid transporter [Shimwellia blattae DSM 4481 = NBRC 105725]VDY65361.1 4-hydroxybenzoate transporter PcaK [Shimwellia blattae]